MKTNKLVMTGLVSTLILGLTTTSIYAYGGNGQGQGKGKTANTGDIVANIPASDLTEKEEEILSYGYSEEMVARDAYNYLYELYGDETFKKIAESEQKHMDAVKVLLDRYGIEAPTGYGDLQSTFDQLKVEGEKGLKEAFEVGIQIEILDIEDIDDAIRNTDNDDFKVVFTKIGGASYNHLRAFLKALDNNDMETEIDTSEFLSEDDLNTRGSLSYKLIDRLEEEGVTLPETVKNTGNKDKGNKGNMSNSKGKGNSQSTTNQNLRSKYKNTIKTKYQAKIDALSEEKLNTLVEKIDILNEKIMNSDSYSDLIKQKYSYILEALKDLALERLGEYDMDLDTLFD